MKEKMPSAKAFICPGLVMPELAQSAHTCSPTKIMGKSSCPGYYGGCWAPAMQELTEHSDNKAAESAGSAGQVETTDAPCCAEVTREGFTEQG